MLTQNIHITADKKEVMPVVHVVQGDTDRKLTAIIKDYDIPVNSTATLSVERPDGNLYVKASTISADHVSTELSQDMLNIAGVAKATIKLTNAGKTVSSFEFVIKVEPSAGFNLVPSSTDSSVYVYLNGQNVKLATDAQFTAYKAELEADVDEKVSELKDDLIDTETRLSESIIEIDNSFVSANTNNKLDKKAIEYNKYINNSGVVNSLDGYYVTGFIKCTKVDTIQIVASGSFYASQIGCAYKNGVLVGAIKDMATVTYQQVSDISSVVAYFNITFNTDCADFDSVRLNTYNAISAKYQFVFLNKYENGLELLKYYDEYSDDIIVKNLRKFDRFNFVECWGDSLTNGVGATDKTTKSYPAVLGRLLGGKYTVNNLGVGGEIINYISARQGGRMAFVQPFTMPSKGNSSVITLKNALGDNVTLATQSGNGLNPVSIDGVYGEIKFIQGTGMTFTRYTSGNSYSLTKAVPLITDGMKNHRGNITIIWAGTNDRPDKSWAETLAKRIRSMIEFAETDKYIVIGLTSKNYMSDIVNVNKVYAEEFGAKFLDIRNYLINYALSDANITPTVQDQIDIANGEIPSSLRSDAVHFNDVAYELIANEIYSYGKILGYWE